MKRFLIALGASYLALLLILFAAPGRQKDEPSPTPADSSGAGQNLRQKGSSGKDAVRAAGGAEEQRPAGAKSVRTLYRNGQVSAVWIFEDGQLSAESVVYYENGNIWLKIPFTKGREQGTVKVYDVAGALSAALTYSSGFLDGRVQYFYPDGSLWSQETWQDGVMTTVPILYSEKQPAPVRSETLGLEVSADKRRQVFKTFYAGGTLSGEWAVLGGKIHGTVKRLSPSGIVLSEASFDAGSMDGTVVHFDAAGRIRQKAAYAKGAREGPSRLYYSDGSLLAEIPYKLGRMSEEPRFYSEGRIRPSSPQEM